MARAVAVGEEAVENAAQHSYCVVLLNSPSRRCDSQKANGAKESPHGGIRVWILCLFSSVGEGA